MTAPGAIPRRGPARVRPAASAAWLPLAALVLIGAVLRFATLGRQSLWFDEAATWQLTQLPLGEMLRALPDRESNPPLFYLLEWLTTRALGDSEAALRALSACAGTALIGVAYAIGARIGAARPGSRRIALAAAALAAVNPMLVWFSQEARNYSLIALLSAVALLLFLHALDDGRPALLGWWAVASALALCSHYFAAFVIAPQAAWLLWRHRRRATAAGAVAAVTLVGAALLPLLLAQRDNPYDIAGQSLGLRMLQVPKQFLLGYHGPLPLLCGVLGAGCLVCAVILLVRGTERQTRDRALFVGGIGLVAVLLAFAGGLLGADYLNARNLIAALPALLAALAAGFAAPRSRHAAVGTAALAGLCAVSLAIVVAVAADKTYQRADWRGLAQALGRPAEPRALVVTPANGEVVLRYYLRDLETLPQDGVPLRDVVAAGVAESGGPGHAPRLPQPTSSRYPDGAFGTPVAEHSDTWTLLRFHEQRPRLAQPWPLAAVRFSQELPSVLLQRPGG